MENWLIEITDAHGMFTERYEYVAPKESRTARRPSGELLIERRWTDSHADDGLYHMYVNVLSIVGAYKQLLELGGKEVEFDPHCDCEGCGRLFWVSGVKSEFLCVCPHCNHNVERATFTPSRNFTLQYSKWGEEHNMKPQPYDNPWE